MNAYGLGLGLVVGFLPSRGLGGDVAGCSRVWRTSPVEEELSELPHARGRDGGAYGRDGCEEDMSRRPVRPAALS